MNTTKHVVLLTSDIFGRGFDSRRLHHIFHLSLVVYGYSLTSQNNVLHTRALRWLLFADKCESLLLNDKKGV